MGLSLTDQIRENNRITSHNIYILDLKAEVTNQAIKGKINH